VDRGRRRTVFSARHKTLPYEQFDSRHTPTDAPILTSRRDFWQATSASAREADITNRDDFPAGVREHLARRAAQHCSNPSCGIPTSGPHQDEHRSVSIGVAAHITAAAAGGPRYNSILTAPERSSIINGIWLCSNCARLIDVDLKEYTEELLRIWKRNQENRIKQHMAGVSIPIGRRHPGILEISRIGVNWTENRKACILDIRASNGGDSDVLINSVEFQVLESMMRMPLGQASYSATYDVDFSDLKEYSDSVECDVAQLLHPGESDRFAIVISAPNLHYFGGWRLESHFRTNIGKVAGPIIEVWLPRPGDITPFSELAKTLAEKVQEHIDRGTPGIYGGRVAIAEAGKIGGFKTSINIGTAVIDYYGALSLARF